MEEKKNIIATIGVNEGIKEPIFLSLTEFKDTKYLDVRKYYKDADEWKPTRKGITLNHSQIENLVDSLIAHKEEIDTWFTKNNL